MNFLRVIRDPRAIVVGSATAAAFITDVAIHSVGTFWAEHPMATGIASGLLLLGVGFWIAGAYLAEHSKPITREAYRSLAADVELVAKLLVWATRSHDRMPGGSGADEECLARATEAATRVGVDARAPVAVRVAALLADDEWRDASRDLLRAARLRLHERAAMWSIVMLASTRLADDFARVSTVSEDLGRLGHALTVEPNVETVVAMWEELKSEALGLQEDFQTKARSPELEARYTSRLRPVAAQSPRATASPSLTRRMQDSTSTRPTLSGGSR